MNDVPIPEMACTACDTPYVGLEKLGGLPVTQEYVYVVCRYCGHIMLAHVPAKTVRNLTAAERVLLRAAACAPAMRAYQEEIVKDWWG